jgi:hypothetical protein
MMLFIDLFFIFFTVLLALLFCFLCFIITIYFNALIVMLVWDICGNENYPEWVNRILY